MPHSAVVLQGFAQPIAAHGNPAQSCGLALVHSPSPVHSADHRARVVAAILTSLHLPAAPPPNRQGSLTRLRLDAGLTRAFPHAAPGGTQAPLRDPRLRPSRAEPRTRFGLRSVPDGEFVDGPPILRRAGLNDLEISSRLHVKENGDQLR